MTCKGFVVAMRARIRHLPFDRPFLPDGQPAPDWLIVSRWGGHAEYLTISSAVRPSDRPCDLPEEAEAAPVGLHPRRTFFGVLAPEEPGGGEAMFLLNRCLPPGVPVAGRFAPAEGYARLRTAEDGTLRLVAVAREVPPEAPPSPPDQQAWMLTAEHCPWAGEFLDCHD